VNEKGEVAKEPVKPIRLLNSGDVSLNDTEPLKVSIGVAQAEDDMAMAATTPQARILKDCIKHPRR
jgi:hypothetical protein